MELELSGRSGNKRGKMISRYVQREGNQNKRNKQTRNEGRKERSKSSKSKK